MIVAGMDFLKSFNLRLYPAGNRIELIPIAHISLQEDQSRQKCLSLKKVDSQQRVNNGVFTHPETVQLL